MPNRNPIPARANGFTLVEILVSIALMGLVIGYFVHVRIEQMKVQLGENIAQEVLSLSNLALSYYLAQSTSGQWPGGVSTPACDGALGVLRSAGYLPASYQPIPSATVSTSCTSGNEGSFDITLQFAVADSDLVQIVRSSLPRATVTPAGANILLVQSIFPPRRAGRNYTFSTPTITNGILNVQKPPCGTTSNSRYMGIPQRICVNHSQGLQGYYFNTISENSDTWTLELCVGSLDTGGGVGCGGGGPAGTVRFFRHVHQCDNADPEVAVVTYCE